MVAVQDQTIILGVTIILTYLTVYRRNKVAGDLFFIAEGFTTYLWVSTDYPWGFILAAIGIGDLIYNVLGDRN